MSAFAFDQDDDWDDTPETELLRAQLYALLARLVMMPPKMDLLLSLQNLTGDASNLGNCFTVISLTSRRMSPPLIQQEFQDLFDKDSLHYIKCHQSEYHKCSATPLDQCVKDLHQDLQGMDIIPPSRARFPVDHAGCLLELMAGMISGAFGQYADLDEQEYFFKKYILSWMPEFFKRLETSKRATFYMPVATLAQEFFEIEKQAFEISA